MCGDMPGKGGGSRPFMMDDREIDPKIRYSFNLFFFSLASTDKGKKHTDCMWVFNPQI